MFCPAPGIPLLATTYNLAESNPVSDAGLVQSFRALFMKKLVFALFVTVIAAPLAFPSFTFAQTASAAHTAQIPQTIAVSQIHSGMHGIAYTVFQGVKPESMDVEVLGVLHNMNGPKGDIILVRMHGTKPEYTGVVAGMSGSPVYFEGKLAGALAFRIGAFSKVPHVGVTPIEEMLEINALDHRPAPARANAPAANPPANSPNQSGTTQTASPGEGSALA